MVALHCVSSGEFSPTLLRGAVDSAVLCRSPVCFVVNASSGQNLTTAVPYIEITRPYPPSGSPHCARRFPHFTCAKCVCGGGGAVSQTQKTQTVYQLFPKTKISA